MSKREKVGLMSSVPVRLTSSGAVVSRASVLDNIVVSGTAVAELLIYDGLNTAGTLILRMTTPDTSTTGSITHNWAPRGYVCAIGIYIDLSGSVTSVTAGWHTDI